MPFLVVAESYQLFEYWRKSRQLREKFDAVYVGEYRHQLRGRNGCTVVFTGFWPRRRDIAEIQYRVTCLVATGRAEVRYEPTLLSDANAETQKFYADLLLLQ